MWLYLLWRNGHLQAQKRRAPLANGVAAGGRKRSEPLAPVTPATPAGDDEERRQQLRQRWVVGLRRSTGSTKAYCSEPFEEAAAAADFTVLAVGHHFFRPDGASMFDASFLEDTLRSTLRTIAQARRALPNPPPPSPSTTAQPHLHLTLTLTRATLPALPLIPLVLVLALVLALTTDPNPNQARPDAPAARTILASVASPMPGCVDQSPCHSPPSPNRNPDPDPDPNPNHNALTRCVNHSGPLSAEAAEVAWAARTPTMAGGPYLGQWAAWRRLPQLMRSVAREAGASHLDLTPLAATRPDRHMGAYKNFWHRAPVPLPLRDCLHYCLPGPTDAFARTLIGQLVALVG